MRLASVLLVLAVEFPTLVGADSFSAPELETRLEEVEDERDLAPIAEWLARTGADPLEVAGALRRGPSHRPVAERDFEIAVRTRDERESVARVLVPDRYDPAVPHALLIALHGHGSDQDQLVGAFRPAADRGWLVAFPAARPSVTSSDPVAALLSRATGRAWWDYASDGVVLATLDEMKRRFNVDEDRVVLTGFSMGGFASWNVGLRFHPLFAGIAPISGAISLLEYTGLRDTRSRSLLANARGLGVFFLHGEEDPIVPADPDRWSDEDLRNLEIPHVFHLVSGGEHWLSFCSGDGAEYEEFWGWLERCRRDPAPDRMVHVAIEDDHRVGDWIEVVECTTRPWPARVEARRFERNRFEISTERVEKIRLYLDPEEVDLAAPISVELDDEKVFEGRVEPSLEAVLASWWAFRGDRKKVTAYAVELGG